MKLAASALHLGQYHKINSNLGTVFFTRDQIFVWTAVSNHSLLKLFNFLNKRQLAAWYEKKHLKICFKYSTFHFLLTTNTEYNIICDRSCRYITGDRFATISFFFVIFSMGRYTAFRRSRFSSWLSTRKN